MTLTQLLKVEDLFENLEFEEEQELDREIEIKNNPELEEIVRDFELSLKLEKYNGSYYNKLEKSFTKPYTAKNIELFSLMLPKYIDKSEFSWKSGYYLSHIINNSKDNKFIIHTKNLTTPLDWLGYQNNSKELIIKGDARKWVGSHMKGGEINIYGNAGYGVGNSMEGGEINLNGDYDSLALDIKGGNIYHKRKLIVKNGRKIK